AGGGSAARSPAPGAPTHLVLRSERAARPPGVSVRSDRPARHGVAWRLRLLPQHFRAARRDRNAAGPHSARPERRLGATACAYLLAGGAAGPAARRWPRPASRRGRPGVAVPGRLVGLGLEGRRNSELADPLSRTDHAHDDRPRAERADPPLHDRDHDPRTL